jgi:ribose transport system ATP-binding protein
VRINSPRQAKAGKVGMALIPEDRKTEGLMLPMAVRDNLSFAAMSMFSRGGIIDRAAETRAIDEMIKLLAIKTDGIAVPAGSLSGGNQQKLVIAKWLMRRPRIILLNDPTRGIDVGTKQELYQLLRKLADDGAAIILYSTDYDELIGCCDTVLVMYDGAVRRRLTGAEITERALIASALSIDAPNQEGTATMTPATA